MGCQLFCKNMNLLRTDMLCLSNVLLCAYYLINFTVSTLGPNNERSCMMRPWLFDILSTVMFAPLVVKLRRVDLIFNSPTLKKIAISNMQVFSQVVAAVFVDVIILIVWTAVKRPSTVETMVNYSCILARVENTTCNMGLSNPFEVAMLTYKCILIAFGVRMVRVCIVV